MKKILFWLIICFLSVPLYAQKPEQVLIDSLITVIRVYQPACPLPCLGDSVRINNLIALASEYKNRNPDTALVLANEAGRLSEKIHWQQGIARSYFQMASSYYIKSDYAEALQFYFKAMELWKTMKERESETTISSTLSNIGNVYSDQGDYVKALDYYFQALKINEKNDDKILIAGCLGNIGRVYYNQGEYSSALDYYFKAIKMEEKFTDKNGLATDLSNIGSVYWSKGDYVLALDYFKEALLIGTEYGYKNLVAAVLGNIGNVYFEQKDFVQALDYYFKSLQIREVLGNKNLLANQLCNIGALYIETKDFAKAESYLQRALSISEENHILDIVKLSNQNLSSLYKLTGNYKKALEYYQKAIVAKDSLFNAEKNKEITKKAMNYEFEKKEIETKGQIALLNKDKLLTNAELEKQKTIKRSVISGGIGLMFFTAVTFVFYKRKTDADQKKKEALLNKQVSEVEMKALRSQMNPHFIFNSLNSIHCFIQQNNGEKASEYLIKFSKLMRLILENSNFEEVPIESDLEALGIYMDLEAARMNNKFTFSIDVSEDLDQESTLIPPLILQPFVENAIWHGMMHKNGPGHIHVSISKKGDMIRCIVEDDGIGREKAMEMKSKKQTGKHKSLGMKLTHDRIEIINRVKKSKAFVAMKDLYDEAKMPCGTFVEVQLPFENSY